MKNSFQNSKKLGLSSTERTEEIRTRKNIYERGFCWSRKVGEWMARAFAAAEGQQKLVPSTRVFPCPKSLRFLGALCASAVCFFCGCGYAAPGNSWLSFLVLLPD